METLFLSADGWRPEGVESDTVSLLVDGKIMVDTGWHAVHNLLREGVAIENVHALLLTHLHQDHRMGLPALLFYWLNSHHDVSPLTIYGPKGVEQIVDMALEFAGKSQDYAHAPGPNVQTIAPGDQLEIGGIKIDIAQSHHAVYGLMYRFTDTDGHVVVYSGDTAPSEETKQFAAGADVLIHEHSWGAVRPKGPNSCGHSSAEDAAQIAKDAGVKQLYIVHAHPASTEESLHRAKAIFENTTRPAAGDRIVL